MHCVLPAAEDAIRRREEAVWQADGRQRWLRESGQVATRPPAIDEAQPERAAFHRSALGRLPHSCAAQLWLAVWVSSKQAFSIGWAHAKHQLFQVWSDAVCLANG